MRDTKELPDLTTHSEFACLKLELSSFTEKQLEDFHILVHLTDQFISRQRLKQQFSAQEYSRQLTLILAEVEMYFTNIVIHLSSFPFLKHLAAILQKILSHYNKIHSFSQEHWQNKFKLVNKSSVESQAYSQFTTMQMCLRCSQNLRHQQIKKARYHLYNPIENPFLLNNPNTYKPEYVQETNQKYLQDKLSELANNVELGQNFMREMIQQLSTESKEINYSDWYQEKEIGNTLPVLPLLKTVYKHFKKQHKGKIDKGVETQAPNLSDEADVVLDSGVCVKANIKMAAELNERSQKIKNMEQRLALSQKQIADLKNQVSVLTQANYKLHKRNSVLEVELNISIAHNKLTKSIKRIEHPRNLHQRTEQTFSQVQSTISKPLQPEEEEIHLEITRKSLKIQHKHKKLELLSPSQQTTPNKFPTFNLNTHNHSKIIRMNQPQLHHKQGSNFSIEKNQQDLGQPSIKSALLNDNFPSKEKAQAQFIKLPKTDKTSKQKYRNNITQHRRVRELVRSQLPSPQKSRRAKRMGTFYKRDQILQILFEEQVKNKDSQADFQVFKNTMNLVIAKVVGARKESNGPNDLLKQEGKQKPRLRQLHKKNAMSIKQNIRNQSAPKGFSDINKAVLGRLSHNSSISQPQDNLTVQIQQIKEVLYFELQSKIDEKTILEKSEHQLMTQLMAYLIKLKVQRRHRYQQFKQILLSTKKTETTAPKSQIDQLQLRISQIIGSHRKCQRLEDKIYCDHLNNFLLSTIQLIS